MPTIAEIIAARQAAKNQPAASAPQKVSNDTTATAPKESIADRVATKEAIDRIDPPGKSEAAANARKASGLILNRNMPGSPEPRGQATPIAGPDLPRSLGATEGETIDVTPLEADECIKDWHKAVNAFATDLCIMRDPVDPERAWLAVRLEEAPRHPLLIKDLLIFDHPLAHRNPSEPF